MPRKLSVPQMTHLIRIDAGGKDGMPAAGFSNSLPERKLLEMGLIRNWRFRIPAGIGSLTIKVELAALTDDGHRLFAALGLPLSDRDARFLGRRQGWCQSDFEPLRVSLLRGYVDIIERRGASGSLSRWRRTASGKDALHGYHEHARRVAEELTKLEASAAGRRARKIRPGVPA